MKKPVMPAIISLVALVLILSGFIWSGDMYSVDAPIYAFVGHFTSKAEYDRAEAYSAAVQKQDMSTLTKLSDPALMTDDFKAIVPQIAGYYPQQSPKSAGVLQYTVAVATGMPRTATLVINHEYNDGVLLTTTSIDQTTGKVRGFYIHRLTNKDLEKIRFNPLQANSTQLLVLTIALANILFTVFTLYRCLSTKGVKLKWLWFVFITAGIAGIQFNWLTHAFGFALIDIRWGAAGITQGLFEPAVIYINLPIGAVVYWLRDRKTKAVSAPAAEIASNSAV